jgi:ribonuclease HI
MWQDRIMGSDPVEENEDIADIREWLARACKNRLYNLSVWDCRGDWAGWDLNGIPDWLTPQKNLLAELLEVATLENRYMRDRWAWGLSGIYTTTAGYKALQNKKDSSHSPAFWKLVWDNLALPKVNFFFWTLVHNKLLTGDNLEKRNIAGPHRCELCRSNPETAQHLFLECNFAKEAWRLSLLDLQILAFPQSTVVELFASWNNIYPFGIPTKSFWRKIWTAVPKYVCWQIWLARNDQIFNRNRHSPLQVAVKAKAFLLEAAQQQYFNEDPLLRPEERRWLSPIEPSPRKLLLIPQTANLEWRIREPEDSFINWWRSKNLTTIFFDGASKGNPENAGAGGVIYSSDGILRDCFYWGLGQKTNNQAEILGLLKACLIAREKGDKDLQVFGDSKILIKKLNTEELFNNASLNKILGRVKRVLQDFTSYKIYHILRNLNGEADQMANKGCPLTKGQIFINDDNFYQIP